MMYVIRKNKTLAIVGIIFALGIFLRKKKLHDTPLFSNTTKEVSWFHDSQHNVLTSEKTFRREITDSLNSYLADCIFFLPLIRLLENPELGKYFPKRSYFDFDRIKLTNIEIKSIEQSNYRVENQSGLWIYDFVMKGIKFQCGTRFRYLPLLFQNTGDLSMTVDNGFIEMELGFESENFDRRGPNYVYLKECNSKFRLTFLSIEGNFHNELISLLTNFFLSAVETGLGNGVCASLNETLIGNPKNETLLSDLMANYSKFMFPYYDDVAVDNDDAWLAVAAYVSPFANGGNYYTQVDLSNPNNLLGRVVTLLTEQVDNYYGASVPHLQENGEVIKDLGINVYLRDNLLQPNGNYVLENSTSVTVDEYNFLSVNEISVAVDNIQITGLDSFQKLKLFLRGKNELTAEFLMDRIRVEADIHTECKKLGEIDITEYETFQTELAPFLELSNVKFEIDSIGADGSVEIPFSETRINEVKLGGILRSDSQLACLFYSMEFLNITMLNLNLMNGLKTAPSLDKFIDPIVGEWTSDFLQFMVDLNQAVLSDAVPNLASVKVYEVVEGIIKQMILDHGTEKCTLSFESFPKNGLVDFRDLLLPKNEALTNGGSGSEPYGSVISDILIGRFLKEQVLVAEEDNPKSPNLNEIVRDFTEKNSTVEGKMVFFVADTGNSQLLEASRFPIGDLYADLSLEIFNASIINIDSFQYPLKILEPSSRHPNVLKNNLMIGTKEKPLKAEILLTGGMVFTDDNGGGSSEEHEFKLVISGSDFLIDNVILATLSERKFMGIRALDVTNPSCLIASFSPATGITYEEMLQKGLNLIKTKISFDTLDLDLKCQTSDCENGRFQFLPKLIQVFGTKGFTKDFFQVLFSAFDDIASGPYVSSILQQFLMDAPRNCPVHTGYSEVLDSGDTSDFSWITDVLPELTKDAHSTLILSALVVYVVFPIMITQTVKADKGSYLISDPLGSENSFGNTSELLDFRYLNESMFSWAYAPIQNISETMGSYEYDPETGISDLNINRWIPDGTVHFDLDDIKLGNIEVRTLDIYGLDSFKKITPFSIDGPHTISTSVQMNYIDFNVGLSIESRIKHETVNHRKLETKSKRESLNIILGFSDVRLDASIFLGINDQRISNIRAGSVFDVQNIISCLNSTLEGLEISYFNFSVSENKPLRVEGFFSGSTIKTLENSHKELLKLFGNDLAQLFPIVSDKYLRQMFNRAIRDYLSKPSTCQYFPGDSISASLGDSYFTGNTTGVASLSQDGSTNPKYVDLRDLLLSREESIAAGGSGNGQYGNLWYLAASRLIADLISPNPEDNGSPTINAAVIDRMSKIQSGIPGVFSFPDTKIEAAINMTRILRTPGTLHFKLFYENLINNINSFTYPLSFINPKSDFLHQNTITLGGPEGPLTLSTRLYLETSYPDGSSYPLDLTLKFQISKTLLDLLVVTRIDEQRLLEFPIADLTNYWCWLNTIPAPNLDEYGRRVDNFLKANRTFALYAVDVNLTDSTLVAKCNNCQPGPSSEAHPETSSMNFLDNVELLISSGIIETLVDRSIYRAQFMCPHSPKFISNSSEIPEFKGASAVPDLDYKTEESFLRIFMGILGFYIAIKVFRLLRKRLAQIRHDTWLLSLSDTEIIALYMECVKDSYTNEQLCTTTSSLVTSQDIPLFVRCFTVFTIIGNVGLFVSGHLDVGGVVKVNFHMADLVMPIRQVYSFSMIELIDNLWTAVSKPLAMMVAFASVIWPYSKQSITLFMWIAPPTIVSPRRRGQVLETLDALGKWSIMDIFIIVISSLAFRLSVSTGDTWPERYLAMDMYLAPMWGLFANLLAQIISQISSHWIIHYQRKVIAFGLERIRIERQEKYGLSQTRRERSSATNHDKPKALCDHKFILGGSHAGCKLQVKRNSNILFSIFGILTVVMVFAGATVPYIQMETSGVIALLQISSDKNPVQNYGIITTAVFLTEIASYIDRPIFYVGFYILAALIVLTCAVVPILQALMTLWLWYIPMKLNKKRKVMLFIEIAKAWQYSEVFVLCGIIMMWQTGLISGGMMDILCGFASNAFAGMAANDLIDAKHARCWHVNAALTGSVSIHIISTMMLWVLSHFVEMAHKQELRDLRVSDVEGIDTNAENEDIMTHLEQNDNNDIFAEVLDGVKQAPLQFTDYYRHFVSISNTESQEFDMQNRSVASPSPSDKIDVITFAKTKEKDKTNPVFVGVPEKKDINFKLKTNK